jgi:hypothetical protein
MGGAWRKRRKIMTRIVTLAFLRTLSLEQLRALHREVQQELARSADGSPEQRQALAALEQISLAITQRCLNRPDL